VHCCQVKLVRGEVESEGRDKERLGGYGRGEVGGGSTGRGEVGDGVYREGGGG
jgi:hypothetical protein